MITTLLSTGISMESSGTTGPSKKIFRSPESLVANNEHAIASQQMTPESHVYTVCSMNHAGGLLAQTLPAYSIKAHVTIDAFSAYEFVRKIRNFTHTHLTPKHAIAIMKTKGFRTLDLTGIWITIGSDPVEWHIIESFVDKGATVMANWGMTEIGPITINTVFKTHEDIQQAKSNCPTGHTILGNNFYCDYDIINGELWVRGSNTFKNSNDWFGTSDLVTVSNGYMYYNKRM
jgi:acyl-CoA synthetase (AMP-forming)/AMP-acid ligase II